MGKTDGGVTVAPGGTVTYTITYQNTGNQADTNVILTETLGANVTFNDGATTAAWVPHRAAGVYTLNVGSLSPSQGALTVDFAVTVDDPLAAGQTQTTNTVSVVGDEDTTPATGTDSTPITATPNLVVGKTDGGVTAVRLVETVTYTITYQNTGNQTDTNVILTETLGANVTFNDAATAAAWVPQGGGRVHVERGFVVAVARCALTVDFAVTVDNPLAAGQTQTTNTVSVVGNLDTTPATGTDSDADHGGAEPDRRQDRWRCDGGSPGGSVTYTITYQNTGNQTDTNVILTETLGANVTFNDAATAAAWVPQGGGRVHVERGFVVAVARCALTVDFAVTVDNPLAAGQTQTTNTVSVVGNRGHDAGHGHGHARRSRQRRT